MPYGMPARVPAGEVLTLVWRGQGRHYGSIPGPGASAGMRWLEGVAVSSYGAFWNATGVTAALIAYLEDVKAHAEVPAPPTR
jgi:hypothetical protein